MVGPSQIQQAGIDINQRTSYSLQWTFTVQRELFHKLVFEAGYLASLGLKLEQNVQPNNAPAGLGAVDPAPSLRGSAVCPGHSVPVLRQCGRQQRAGGLHQLPAALRAVELSLRCSCASRSRSPKRLSWLTSYTFSKAITNAPQFRNAGGVNGSENSPPQDSFNLRAERALASFDTRHRLVNTLVYKLPFGRDQRFLRYGLASKVLGGWETSGIFTMQSGFPFTPNLKGDTAGVGAGTGGIFVRPNLVPGADWRLSGDQQSTSRFFNTAAFASPAAGTFGNVGRNTIIGPGFVNADVVVARYIHVKEGIRLQFRAEFFNTLNHPNYNLVGRIVNDPTFGQVLSQFDPRQLQFGLKLTF